MFPILLVALSIASPPEPVSTALVYADVDDRMFPEGREYDFGKVTRGTLVKHTFCIVNRSGIPLQITSVRRSGCSSITCSVTKETLLPNEEGRAEIVVDTNRFTGRKTVGLVLTTEHGKVTQEFRFSVTGVSEDRP